MPGFGTQDYRFFTAEATYSKQVLVNKPTFNYQQGMSVFQSQGKQPPGPEQSLWLPFFTCIAQERDM